MDFPYLAALWNPLDPQSATEAAGVLSSLPETRWTQVLRHSGFALYTNPPPVPYLASMPLRDDNGAILGILFNRGQNRRLTPMEIREDPALATMSTGTIRHLTRNYWGAYVAFLWNRHTRDWWVVRDCSGMIPCYYTTNHGVTLLSSDARSFLSIGNPYGTGSPVTSVDINWTYVAGFLANSQLQIRETGLKNVYELLAGETICHHKQVQSVELSWDPASFIDTDPRESRVARREALRHTVTSCIHAWASAHDWVVHCLSGGFDSSLVLALLASSPKRPHIVCVNRYSAGPAEDERPYARTAAHAAGIPLIEWPWNFGNRTLDASCLNFPVGVKPSITNLFSPLEAPFLAALNAAHHFDAIWTGEGGDHLLLALNTELLLTDFLRIRGFRSGLLETLRDAAKLTGHSIPRLITNVLRDLCNSRRSDLDAPDAVALPSDASPLNGRLRDYIRHPWACTTAEIPPGKRRQILLLAEVIHRLRPLPATQECVELQPLLSQPIIEQCLSIPTYDLLESGRTRGLARAAFATELPIEILNRESKGQTTHHVLGLIYRSLPFVSDLLLDGMLVRQGLLNRAKLEPVLTEKAPINASQLFPVLACLAAEIWTRSWNRIDYSACARSRSGPPLWHSTKH